MSTRTTARLRELLATEQPVFFPDCNTALAARVLEQVGFTAGYAGGHSTGMMHYAIPDYGLLTPTEMIDQARRMCMAVDIPLIFDADEFGGTVPGAHRNIALYINAGAAGVHMEDEQIPKHSAWRGGLVSVEDMQERVAAAALARDENDPNFVIFARCNELQNRLWYGDGTLDEMIRRGQAYAEAGADVFLANFATEEDLPRIVAEVPIPVCTYNSSRADAVRLGLGAVIFTGWATPVMIDAFRRNAQVLLDTGELPPEAYVPLQDKSELIGETFYSDMIRDWAKKTGRPSLEGLAGPPPQ
jgi:2-methylisocitrate lyase-like PEP mutase family enzyme